MLETTCDRLLQSVGGTLDAEAMGKLSSDAITLIAYRMMRDEVMDGGFIQLIHNGLGPFIFLNPFAKAIRQWGEGTDDEELLHAFATRLIVFDGGRCRIFEGTYADFLEKVGWASEKKPGGANSANIKVSNIDVKGDGLRPHSARGSAAPTTSATPRASMDRKARADYIAERSKIVKPLEKQLTKLEEDIAKAETLGGELEAKLVTASESGDGNAITAIAKDMDDNKKKVDQLYEEWECVSAELDAAKDKYPI